MRKTPSRWDDVRVGDILMHAPTDRIFRVETMVTESGSEARIVIHVMNLMTRVLTMWVVAPYGVPNELDWIGPGG